jgi:hypothetical protein
MKPSFDLRQVVQRSSKHLSNVEHDAGGVVEKLEARPRQCVGCLMDGAASRPRGSIVARPIIRTGAGASFDLHQAGDRKHSRDGCVKLFILRRELFYPKLWTATPFGVIIALGGCFLDGVPP